MRFTSTAPEVRTSTAPWIVGVVPLVDGVDDQAAHPRERKHLLDDDRPTDQVDELGAGHGHHRDQRVPERVLVDDAAVGHALGARGADVVLPQHVQHAAAREARHDRRDGQAEGGGGGQHGAEAARRALAERHVAQGGQPGRVAGTGDDHDGPDEKRRGGDEEEREHAGRAVEGAPGPGRRQHPHRDAGGQRDGHRHERELERHRVAARQLVADRQSGDEGMAEVAPEHVAQPERVLGDEGPVEVQRLDQRLARLLVLAGGDPEEDGHEVPGDQVDQHEGDHRDPEQCRDQQEQPLGEVGGHRRAGGGAAMRPGLSARATSA